jgi:uncharacterized protein YecE (DUF72 family)
MAEIRVGICSWTDRTLIKSGFYPRGASTPAARLAHYAARFGTVEADSAYYALPDPAWAFRWIAGTPVEFSFGVKSFALFTFHRTRYSNLPRWLRAELGERDAGDHVRREDVTHEQRVRLFGEFLSPVRLLHEAGKLSYLLFQFPPKLGFSREGLIYFRRLREMAGPLPLAVEVRNNTWLADGNRDKFFAAREVQNIAYTAVDEPRLGWTLGPDWPVTSEWGSLVRFHGRNSPGWRSSRAGVHERFDYMYEGHELEEWLPRVERASDALGGRGKIFLMFNNCVSDKAVRSARLMMEMLGIPAYEEDAEGRQTLLGL